MTVSDSRYSHRWRELLAPHGTGSPRRTGSIAGDGSGGTAIELAAVCVSGVSG